MKKNYYQFLIVRYAWEEVKDFVVSNDMRPNYSLGEFDDAPGEQEHSNRNKVKHEHHGKEEQSSKPAELGDGKVKGTVEKF